jgi:hypothetical protein
VKLLIGLEEALDLVAGGKALELPVDRLEPAICSGCARWSLPARSGLRAWPSGEDLVQILLRDLGHEAAAARPQRHQPFGRQNLQRFAQGRPADAVIDRQQLLVDAVPGGNSCAKIRCRSLSATSW